MTPTAVEIPDPRPPHPEPEPLPDPAPLPEPGPVDRGRAKQGAWVSNGPRVSPLGEHSQGNLALPSGPAFP